MKNRLAFKRNSNSNSKISINKKCGKTNSIIGEPSSKNDNENYNFLNE